MVLDVDILQSPKLVEAVYAVGKALVEGKECQVSLGPDDDESTSCYKTVLTVKDGDKLSLHGLWLPSRDANFQRRLGNNEATYKSPRAMDEWRSTRSWVGLGAGIEDFLEFARALNELLPNSVGGGQTVSNISCKIFYKLSQTANVDSSDEEDAVNLFRRYACHLQKDTKPFIPSGGGSLLKIHGSPSFLDKLLSAEITKGTISRPCAKLAKATLAKAAGIYLNSFILMGLVEDKGIFIRRMKNLIAQEESDKALEQDDHDEDLIAAQEDAERAENERTSAEAASIDYQDSQELEILPGSTSEDEAEEEEEATKPNERKRKAGGINSLNAEIGKAKANDQEAKKQRKITRKRAASESSAGEDDVPKATRSTTNKKKPTPSPKSKN